MDTLCTQIQKGIIMAVHPAITSSATEPQRLAKHTLSPLGLHVVLYCGSCQAIVVFDKARTGPVKDWPYCPVHQENPLIVRPVSP
jgi:hypothetical protein